MFRTYSSPNYPSKEVIAVKKLKFDLPSPAMVVGVIACLLALGGVGVAAKKAKKKIGSGRIKDGAITNKKLKKNAVSTDKMQDNAVTTPKIAAAERSEAFLTSTPGEIALPAATDTTVATLNVPAGGKYVLNASVTVASDAATARVVDCALKEGATVLTQGSELTSATADQYSGNIALTGTTQGGSITLSCKPDMGAKAKFRAISATRAGAITIQ